LHHAFPLDVPMVPSSSIAVAADGEYLMCGGFSLGETVRLGNFEFIADYFGGLSLSPRRGDIDVSFMGPTRSGASTPRRTMIGDFAEEFLTMPSGEGSFGLPSPRRRGTGVLLAPVTITLWKENSLTAQATMTVPPWTAMLWSKTDLPFEQCHARQGGQQAQARVQQPTTEQEAAPQ
jgi:hypothetical protein